MATHLKHTEKEVVYFVTFTCYKWLSLIKLTNCYDSVYNWFKYLLKQNCNIIGYVIMPNHVHCILYLGQESKNLNTLVSNGKRFMAYDIVKRLTSNQDYKTLNTLKLGVSKNELKKGKKHQVFKLSFDAKVCVSEKMIIEILDYIHHNPVSGKWDLAYDFTDYQYSRAKFYVMNEVSDSLLTHYKNL